MLHDDLIRERIVVVAAIDERILLRAIESNYASASPEDRAVLSREYMDKLFIAGLRLGPLAEVEKDEIFDGFTRSITNPLPRSSRINSNPILYEEGSHAEAGETGSTSSNADGPTQDGQSGPQPMRPEPTNQQSGSGSPVPPAAAAADGEDPVLASRFEVFGYTEPGDQARIRTLFSTVWQQVGEQMPANERDMYQGIVADLLLRFDANPDPVQYQDFYDSFASSVKNFSEGLAPDGTHPFVLRGPENVKALCQLLDAVEEAISWDPIESPWELEYEESAFLKDCLDFYSDPTPRNIRVFTIRFLLGKKLMERELAQGKGGWSEWHHGFEGKHWFAMKLIEYSSVKGPNDLDQDLAALVAAGNGPVSGECFGKEYTWPKPFVTKALKILAMVVAY